MVILNLRQGLSCQMAGEIAHPWATIFYPPTPRVASSPARSFAQPVSFWLYCDHGSWHQTSSCMHHLDLCSGSMQRFDLKTMYSIVFKILACWLMTDREFQELLSAQMPGLCYLLCRCNCCVLDKPDCAHLLLEGSLIHLRQDILKRALHSPVHSSKEDLYILKEISGWILPVAGASRS